MNPLWQRQGCPAGMRLARGLPRCRHLPPRQEPFSVVLKSLFIFFSLPAEVPLLFRCRRGDNMQFAYCWRQPGSLFIGAAGEPGNYRRRLKPQGPAGRGGGDVPATGERRTRVEPGGCCSSCISLSCSLFVVGSGILADTHLLLTVPFLARTFDFFLYFFSFILQSGILPHFASLL